MANRLHSLQTDMQQLVENSNDPSRFRSVLVPKRDLHKLLEEAKTARDSAGFLLNGVSEIPFSPKELATAKGVTKARAGTAALDEEKVDALFVSLPFFLFSCTVASGMRYQSRLASAVLRAAPGHNLLPSLSTARNTGGDRRGQQCTRVRVAVFRLEQMSLNTSSYMQLEAGAA
ncbi:hypothetical protein NDU88_003614 [Pleurodeles waltl]|uniref:Uncharacterized protein n=1 Tax=Pleurodeles waltl TaxID=8319 RepID=A0AAV7TP35_PLEWA|nr:hypothetical protein NDU88_003614 [Pleurodeles waltl]